MNTGCISSTRGRSSAATRSAASGGSRQNTQSRCESLETSISMVSSVEEALTPTTAAARSERIRSRESIVRNTGDCGTQYQKLASLAGSISQPPDGQDASVCAPSTTNRTIRAGPRCKRTKQHDAPGASENWSRINAARPETSHFVRVNRLECTTLRATVPSGG